MAAAPLYAATAEAQPRPGVWPGVSVQVGGERPRSVRGRGPRWGQYGDQYGGARSYYGRRGDNRWRYYDGARPAWSGGPYWWGGPPYDRPHW